MFTVLKCQACGIMFEKYGYVVDATCPICDCKETTIMKTPDGEIKQQLCTKETCGKGE